MLIDICIPLLINFIISLTVNGYPREESWRSHNEKRIKILVAVFVDQALSNHLTANLGLNQSESRLFITTYIDQVNAIFAGLSSKTVERVNILLVDVRFGYEETGNVSHLMADIDKLLSDFCLHQMEEHKMSELKWDLALLLTARDLYSLEEAKATGSLALSGSTMGISPVNGIEWPDLSCMIVEFGVGYHNTALIDGPKQRVYPSRGFASTNVAAHELAHNLGIHHDAHPCEGEKWLMSSGSHIAQMNTQWSRCSSAALDSLTHLNQFRSGDQSRVEGEDLNLLPGQIFNASFQCRAFSAQLSGFAITAVSICNETLFCSAKDGQLIPVGPALEGTQCAPDGSMCLKNHCLKSRI